MSSIYLTPDGLHRNPVFSQVVVTEGNVRTIYVGGQNGISPGGEVVGKGDMKQQANQVFKNLGIAFYAAGAQLENIIKWSAYIVRGQVPQSAFEEF